MVRRAALVLIAVALVVSATGTSASAQTKKRLDARGDGPRAADVRSIRVQNNANKLAVTVRLARVVKGRTAVLIGTSRRLDAGDARTVLVDVYPVARGRYQVRGLVFEPTEEADGTIDRLPCAEQDSRVRRGRAGLVKVVIPASCLGSVAGRQESAAIGYDKRAIGTSFASSLADLRALRRGDADAPGEPDIDDLLDETVTVTTRRG